VFNPKPTESSPYHALFRSCGEGVSIAPDVYIENPECFEFGSNVTIHSGTQILGRPKVARIGSNVTFHPRCHLHGSPGKLVIGDHVEFYTGVYMGLGNWDSSFIEIGHHSHFAPYGILYGWGGLQIGPYCNVAAHVVLATVGHHDEIIDQPMALTGEKAGPITLVEDVWIAANATICAHTTLAKGCVIAANAVVTRDTEPMGIYGGVPAKLMRMRGEG
jgi:acetyltransferase-like isoleucine patch superfamily enzyme